jgi:hypothetical protein
VAERRGGKEKAPGKPEEEWEKSRMGRSGEEEKWR